MMSEGEKKIYLALYLNKGGLHLRDICRVAGLTLPAVVSHINRGEAAGRIVCEKRGRMKICRLDFKSRNLVPAIQEIGFGWLQKLPNKIRDSINSFIDDLREKPIIVLVFGSVARNQYTKKSDLDILLVFQRIDSELAENIEKSAGKIKGRSMVNIQPVSLSYDEFERSILNMENEFMKDIRKNAIVLQGVELYLKLLGRAG